MRANSGPGSFLIFLLLAAWPGLALAQMTVDVVEEAPAPNNPKIVLQTFPYGGIELAAWTRDDRYIVTASQASRMVMIWDAETGYVIDRLPIGGSNVATKAAKAFTDMTVSEDNQTVKIIEREIDSSDGRFTTQIKTGSPSRYYSIDLKTREVQMAAKGGGLSRTTQTGEALATWQSDAASGARSAFQQIAKIRAVMERTFENGGVGQSLSGGLDAIPSATDLPPLPMSYDGKRALLRTADGLVIKQKDKADVEMVLERSLRFHDAALSPDGILLAMVPQMRPADADGKKKMSSSIELFDVAMGKFINAVSLPAGYSQIQWLDNNRLLATEASNVRTRRSIGKQSVGEPPRGAVIDAHSGTVVEWIKPQCYLTGAPSGVYFGAGLANCRDTAAGDVRLKRYDPKSRRWDDFGDRNLTQGSVVASIAVSDTGQTLAVNAVSKDGKTALLIFDTITRALIFNHIFTGEGGVNKIILLGDDGLFVSSDRETATWTFADDMFSKMPLKSQDTKLADSDGYVVAIAGTGDEVIELMNLETGQRMKALPLGRVIAGGFLPDISMFWAMSAHDGLRLWNTDSGQWSEVLTTYFFENEGFLAVTPEGRYDTNLGPDTSLFRWLVPDQPFQSLAPQTFMRDYYTPKLSQRTIECISANNCKAAFAPVTPISQLNRVLPEVTITDVKQGDTPDEAIVSLKVTEGVGQNAKGETVKSGVYDLRLFRDYRFAKHDPDNQDLENQKLLLDWRRVNRLVDDDDAPGDGVYHKEFRVLIPTARGKEKPVFSAYAFNEDRAKSETFYDSSGYSRPVLKPLKPRAFVISIGVDFYLQDRLNLKYAAADAKLMDRELKQIPGYEMHNLLVTSEEGKDPKPTADAINMILAMLAGFDREEGLKILAEAGIDGRALDRSLPDDIVIFSFSGHGYADAERNFYLLPTDAEWNEDDDPATHSFVSTPELTMWLRVIDAADIVMIIDACYAAASVEDINFKPGPMGDSGLGQLAYDKGIKILVATQADDVAMENDDLNQGLLTFALAGRGEGFSNSDGLIDAKADGKISLDEWINYPVFRLPTLNDDKRVTGGDDADNSTSSFRFPGRTAATAKKIQQPTLFDYGDLSPISMGRIRK